ncbi:MAG: alpha-ketoglutarate-dependent dioxygenase AlkB [Lentilitoribacter sp.]
MNEYLPGQGIAPHVDCVPCFDNTIASLSLISSCEMNFRNLDYPELKSNLYLKPRSLLVLKDKSRLDWTHGIAPRKSDVVNGVRLSRTRRLSLTFRKVII